MKSSERGSDNARSFPFLTRQRFGLESVLHHGEIGMLRAEADLVLNCLANSFSAAAVAPYYQSYCVPRISLGQEKRNIIQTKDCLI